MRMDTTVLVVRRHAYNPRNGIGGEGRQGNDHYVVVSDVAVGRIRRRAGDALCGRRFWELNGKIGYRLCPRCEALATRFGVAVAADEQEQGV